MMQKQFSMGMAKITDKMNQLEGKLSENDDRLKKFDNGRSKEQAAKAKAESKNTELYREL